jgi:hypothetical protein
MKIFIKDIIHLFVLAFAFLMLSGCANTIRTYEQNPKDGFFTSQKPNYLKLSYEMLQKLKAEEDVAEIRAQFAASTQAAIQEQIVTDAQKIAFWVNVYNAYIQDILQKHPEYYEDRRDFFSKAQIEIAGRTFSFAEIEHGIIRSSQNPLGLGKIPKFFPPAYERKLRVTKRDARIHFALNCGAKSCPPVAIFHPEKLDKELDFMSTKYLQEFTTYDASTKTATTTTLFSWFRGDFRNKGGVKNMLFDYKITPEKPKKLKYSSYDWTLFLDNYREIKL